MASVSKIAEGKYDTGTIVKYGTAYIYIPKNLSKNPKASIFYPGYQAFTGSNSDISRYLGKAIASQGGNQIVIVESYNKSGTINPNDSVITTINNTNTNIIKAIEKAYNIKISSVSTMGSSMGDRYALKNYVSLVKSGRDTGCCILMGISDAGKAGKAILTNEEYKVLKGKTVFTFEPTDATGYKYINMLAKKGVNVILVACKNGDHNALTANPVRSNVFKLIDGNPQNFLNSSNYTFVRYDSSRGKWVTMSDAEVKNVSKKLANASSGTVATQKSGKNNLTYIYGYSLASLNSVAAALQSSYSSKIVCNNDYVRESLQNICSAVNTSPFLAQQTITDFASTTTVPDEYSNEFKTIMATVLQLHQLLYQDLQNITICGVNIEALDNTLANNVDNLTNNDGLEDYGTNYTSGGGSSSKKDDDNNDSDNASEEVVVVEEPASVEPTNLVYTPDDGNQQVEDIKKEEEEIKEVLDEAYEEEPVSLKQEEVPEPTIDTTVEEKILNVPDDGMVEEPEKGFNKLLAALGLVALGAAVGGTAYGVKKYKEAKEQEEYEAADDELETDDIDDI